jgi:UDP-GlcNAc:undecaprenyl-phosphate GlcNAc-1-phosphate transferase
VPLLILAVPIFDTLSVVIIRLERGRSPFQADTNHFSHRLVALGMSPRMAVLTIYLVTATVGLGATVVYHATTAAAVLVLLQAAAVFAVIVLLERAARKVARAELGRKESEIPAEQTDSSGNQNVP